MTEETTVNKRAMDNEDVNVGADLVFACFLI